MKLLYLIKQLFLIAPITILFITTSCSNTNEGEEIARSAETYYISENGNDDDNGSSANSPWQTLKKLEGIKFKPGDSILFEKSSEFIGSVRFKSSGVVGEPILLGSYGEGRKPTFTNSDYNNLNGNVFQVHSSYVTIDGLSFKNCANSESKVNEELLLVGAIYAVTGADGLIVRNCEFIDCPISIYVNSQHCLLTNNYLHDCNRFLSEPDWGPIAVFIANAYNEISYNTCSNYIKVGGNYGADGGFLELDARFFGNQVHDIKVHHNKSFGNMGFMEVEASASGDNLDVYYNLSDDYQEFIFYWGGNNSKIENNTVIRTKPSKNGAVNTVFTMAEGNFILRNNIFIVSNGVQVLVTAPYEVGNYDNVVHENNLYYCIDGSTFDPCGKPLEPGEMIADPQFVNFSAGDYHLHSESPAISAGLSLGYTSDLDNNHVLSGSVPNIGAY